VSQSTTAHSFQAIRKRWDPERKPDSTLIIRSEDASGVSIPRETITFFNWPRHYHFLKILNT
jgi:hypothetical protein